VTAAPASPAAREWAQRRGLVRLPDSWVRAVLGTDDPSMLGRWADHLSAWRAPDGSVLIVSQPYLLCVPTSDAAQVIAAAEGFADARGLELSIGPEGWHHGATAILEFRADPVRAVSLRPRRGRRKGWR
jgi:hypothetical protein